MILRLLDASILGFCQETNLTLNALPLSLCTSISGVISHLYTHLCTHVPVLISLYISLDIYFYNLKFFSIQTNPYSILFYLCKQFTHLR